MHRKLIISLLVGGLISALTLYLAFRNVPLRDLLNYLGTIDYVWLLPTAALVMVAFILRVYRWRIILKGAQAVGFWQAFHPLMIGFMMNCVLPGRVGEIARPAILRKQRGVPISTGLATVGAERVFDAIILLALFAMVSGTITSRPDLDINFAGLHLNSQTLASIAWGIIRISVILLVGFGLLILPITRRWLKHIIVRIGDTVGAVVPRIKRFADKFSQFAVLLIDNFAAGLDLVRHPLRMLACFGLTVLIWGISVLSYYVFAMGTPGVDLSLFEMTTVLVVVCFFIALPSVPGFWGLWEAGGVFALSLFGVAAKDAAGFTLVNHAIQMFPVIIIGLISALVTSVNIMQFSTDKRGVKPVPAN